MNIWKGNFSQKRIFGLFSKFYTKLAITQPKIIFFEKLKKCFLDRCMRNVIYQFQSSNDQGKPVRQYGRQTGITKNLATFRQKKSMVNFFRSPVTLYAKIIMGLSPLVFPQLFFKVTKKSYRNIEKGQ